MLRRLFILTLFGLTLLTDAIGGDVTVRPIDFPGSATTAVSDINAAGDIVGEYTDATGRHGFLLQGNTGKRGWKEEP